MPQQLLVMLTNDVSQVLAAGLSRADGLRTHIPALETHGWRVPALTAVAAAVERVAGPAKSETALLDLVLLLRQVRGALATAAIDGDAASVEPGGPWATALSSEILYPVFDGLTRPGPWSAVKQSGGRALPADMRLLDSMFGGLRHRFGELVDFVEKGALPAFGRALVPEIGQRWDPRGQHADVRLLGLLCRLDKTAGAEACRRAVRDGSGEVRAHALSLLPSVVPSEVAVPVLIDALRGVGEKPRTCAEESLAHIGRPAVSPLIAALKDRDARLRSGAAASLGRIGAAAAAAVPALEQALRDRRSFVREQAARALGRIGPEARAVIPCLAKLIENDSEVGVVSRSIGALEDLGAEPAAVVPIICGLVEDLRDDFSNLPFNAISALGALGPDAREGVPILCCILQKPTDGSRNWVHTHSMLALASIGPDAAPAVPLLLREANNRHEINRRVAIQTLGQIGPAARAAIPEIATALADPVWEVRWQAACALPRIVGWDLPAIPDRQAFLIVLAEAVQERHYNWTLESALAMLRRLDPSGDTAVRHLREALDEPKTIDRQGVRRELVRRGVLPAEPRRPTEPLSIPAVKMMLDQDDLTVQWNAIDAISRGGPAARALAPCLVAVLRSECKWLRGNAAHALLALGTETRLALAVVGDSLWDYNSASCYADATHARRDREEVRGNVVTLAALKEALADEDEPTRLRAALVLARLEAADEAVISVLASAAATDPHDGLTRLRLGATKLLGEIGAAARSAWPILSAALGKLRHWEQRSAVRTAVGAIREAP